MKISNLITQTFENSVNEDRAESVNHSKHIFNFTGFDHQGNQARNNAISRSFTTLKYNNKLYSGEQYDLREFILEETRNRPAGSMDVDVEFGQDVPTDIETPLGREKEKETKKLVVVTSVSVTLLIMQIL
ncbi:hypothetical protein F4703DRAFT_1798686 [Phycomyces blakesleeanus]